MYNQIEKYVHLNYRSETVSFRAHSKMAITRPWHGRVRGSTPRESTQY